MSRSQRRTPIFGHTTARSEQDDKRLWHKRWRTRELDRLAVITPDTDHVAVPRNAVSSTWSMAKDGKFWFGHRQQLETAQRLAWRKANRPEERKSLQARLLAKWRSK